MPYTKTTWAAGNRVSIERLNKMEDAVNTVAQLNASNQAHSDETNAMLSDTGVNISQANTQVSNGTSLLQTISPPAILTDGWALFDAGSAASSTAETITRTLSGFVTRANDATLFQNNGGSIQILKAGRYLIARSVRLGGARAILYKANDSNWEEAFLIGGSGSTYKTIHTVSTMEVYDAAAGAQIKIRAQIWGNSSGMTLSFAEGKIAIKKVG